MGIVRHYQRNSVNDRVYSNTPFPLLFDLSLDYHHWPHFEIPFAKVSWVRHRDIHILTAGAYTYTSDQRFQALHRQNTGQNSEWSEWTLCIKWAQERDRDSTNVRSPPSPSSRINSAWTLSVSLHHHLYTTIFNKISKIKHIIINPSCRSPIRNRFVNQRSKSVKPRIARSIAFVGRKRKRKRERERFVNLILESGIRSWVSLFQLLWPWLSNEKFSSR